MQPACLVQAEEQRRRRIDVILEGDSPPENNEPPCTPGKRHQLPDLSTAELFREFEHMMLRRKLRRDVDPSTAEAGYMEQEIQRHVLPLPKTCKIILMDNLLLERQIETSPTSHVYVAKVADGNGGVQPCFARHMLLPSRQFWREVSVWSTLRHENVVRFIGLCMTGVGPVSLCEHYPEGSLFTANAALVAQAHAQLEATSGVASAFNGQGGSPTGAGAGQPVTPVAFGMRPGFTQFSYLQQICRAMTYLHTLTPCPVLFRNLKSPNLMLDKNRTRILLTDLAISRPLSQHANLTPAQGSDRWLAPEVQAGNDYDLRADVFSFGMVCWEVVTCELPFASYSTRQTAVLISKGYRPLLPPHTAEWAMKLMSICNAHVPEARATFPGLFAVFEQARDPTQLSASLDDMLNHAVQVMSHAGMVLPAQDPRNGIMPSPPMQQQQPQMVQPQAMQPQTVQLQMMQPQAMRPQTMRPISAQGMHSPHVAPANPMYAANAPPTAVPMQPGSAANQPMAVPQAVTPTMAMPQAMPPAIAPPMAQAFPLGPQMG